jgi:hypothetical protein
VDDVKSSSTKEYCRLQLVKCYASLHQNQLGFVLLSLVEDMPSEDGCLRLFCAVSLPLLKLRTQLNTLLLADAFPPRISDNSR